MEQQTMDRRNFLKGALATGALAAGGAMLAGCSPAQPKDAASAGTAAQAAGTSGSSLPKGYECAEDWLGAKPEVADSDIVDTKDFDIVVCGGGNAGVQAALAAAQEGAKVAVLEIQPEATWTQLGNDICAFSAQWLVDKGYGPYKTGDIVAEFIRRGGGRVSAEIIRKFVANSGDMLDNIVAQIPDTSNLFDLETGQAQIQVAYNMPDGSSYPFTRGGFQSWATTIQNLSTKNPTPVCGREGVSRMTEIALYCKEAAEKLGAEFFFETDVTVLDQDGQGNVTGVVAKGKDGLVRYQAAKGVILATGDFGANPDMVVNLCTDINEQSLRCDIPREEMTGESNCKGAGHKLGCWAGGFIEQAPRPCMNTNGGNAGPWGTTPFLWLNDYGKRFMNEAMTPYIKPTTLKQPRGILATICDSKYMDVMKQCSTDHFSPNWGAAGVDIIKIMDRMDEQMQSAVGKGAEGVSVDGVYVIEYDNTMPDQVYAADTIDELLGYLGYEGDAKKEAAATIEHYNELCRAGEDSDFGKDDVFMSAIENPPFFGSAQPNTGRGYVGLVSLCGLVTDDDLQVLSSDLKTPIKGLYAVGNCLGQRFGNAYSTPAAGSSIGMALTHGYVAGKIAAGGTVK